MAAETASAAWERGKALSGEPRTGRSSRRRRRPWRRSRPADRVKWHVVETLARAIAPSTCRRPRHQYRTRSRQWPAAGALTGPRPDRTQPDLTHRRAHRSPLSTSSLTCRQTNGNDGWQSTAMARMHMGSRLGCVASGRKGNSKRSARAARGCHSAPDALTALVMTRPHVLDLTSLSHDFSCEAAPSVSSHRLHRSFLRGLEETSTACDRHREALTSGSPPPFYGCMG
jgi:hypothetical protein